MDRDKPKPHDSQLMAWNELDETQKNLFIEGMNDNLMLNLKFPFSYFYIKHFYVNATFKQLFRFVILLTQLQIFKNILINLVNIIFLRLMRYAL